MFVLKILQNEELIMKIIIGLYGKKGSGKDTFADYLVENYGFQKVSFASPLKKLCKDLFSLSEEDLNDPILKEKIHPQWNLSPRQILQKVGTDLFRTHFSSTIWVDIMKTKLENMSANEKIVISDIRFQNEYDLIGSFENSFIIQIERNSQKNSLDTHISENWQFSSNLSIQNNDSKEKFFEEIEICLKKIL